MSPETPEDSAAVFDALVAERRQQQAPEPEPDTPEPEPTESQQEPAPEAGSSVSGVSDPAPATAAQDDINLDSLPPAVKARIERAQQLEAELQRERSDKLAALNRLQPTQRRLSDLERQLAAVSKAPAPQATQATPAAPSVGSPKWDAWAKQFPEDAEAILERDQARASEIAEMRAELARLRGEVAPIGESVNRFAQEQNYNRETAALDEAHPDWRDVIVPREESEAVQVLIPVQQKDGSTKDVPYVVKHEFGAWLSVQHEAKKRQLASDFAADYQMLMDDYKRDAYLASLHESQPVESATPEAQAAQRAHQRREQARAASVTPDLRGQPAAARVSTEGMSDAELFDHLARQRKRQMRA